MCCELILVYMLWGCEPKSRLFLLIMGRHGGSRVSLWHVWPQSFSLDPIILKLHSSAWSGSILVTWGVESSLSPSIFLYPLRVIWKSGVLWITFDFLPAGSQHRTARHAMYGSINLEEWFDHDQESYETHWSKHRPYGMQDLWPKAYSKSPHWGTLLPRFLAMPEWL